MQKLQTNIASDILLDLPAPAGPAHARLAHALREAIRSGRLAPGSTLPPSRALASDLSCSRWVVTEAYAQLAAEGYLAAIVGSGTRVRDLDDGPAALLRTAPPQRGQPEPAWPPPRDLDMAPGLPDLRTFPMRRWASAVRSATAGVASADLGYPDVAGHQRLRRVLAEYLVRARGAQTDPAAMVITSGATDAIGLLCRTLHAHGCKAVALEDPGWHRLREVVMGAGLVAIPVPVDSQGLQAGLLHLHRDIGAVIVSPAHQFPSGVVLSPQRRLALLDWARSEGGLIIEDDYDAEFRYDRRPVGALQGAGQAGVALVGSVSKTLSPAVGIGWMATPPGWASLVRAAVVRPSGPPVLDQLAFAAFLESGSYHRHLRAARIRYRARRDSVIEALAEQLPGCTVAGAAAGLHLLVHLPDGTDAAAVVRAAAAAAVRVANLDTYRFSGRPDRPGLVLGYGNLADHQLTDAVTRLASAVRRVQRTGAAHR